MKKIWAMMLAILVSLGLIMPASAANENEAKIGTVTYPTLNQALDKAKSGDTIELLKNVEYNGYYEDDSRYSFAIDNKSITIDGANHSLTLNGGQRGIYLKGSDDANQVTNVTFKNITIENNQNMGRVIDTRGGHFNLVLDGVTLSTHNSSGNTQVLTVGGSHSHHNSITIKNSNLVANDAGYGIITFNPVNLMINDSQIEGYATLYLKTPDYSFGSKNSVVNITNSTLTSVNPHTFESKSSFANICVDDKDIQINIKDSIVHTKTTSTAAQATVSFLDDLSDGSMITFNGNTRVTCAGDFAVLTFDETKLEEKVNVKSGTFNTVEALKYLEENAKVTVKLDKDVNESIVIPKNTNVTLDLNGKNITNTDGQHTILNQGNLTIVGKGIIDNKSNGRGALVNDKGSGAVATIEGGEFTRSQEAGSSSSQSGGNSWYVISNEEGCTMNIKNANVHSTGKYSSLVRNYGTMNITGGKFDNQFITIKNEEDSKLNITGGEITSSTQAIQTYGETKIKDGKIKGQVTVSKYDKFDSIINITGGEVSGDILVWDDSKATGKVNATVDGAHITGNLVIWNENKQPIKETDELNIDVKSGTFDKNVSTYVVNERGLIKVDGTYYVDEAKVLNEVASKASKSVEILKGIDTISVPAGVEVTNNSGDDVVVNGEVLADGQKVTVTNKETVNMILAAVINGKVIAGEDLVELMKLGGATNITVDDLTEKVEKGYALTKEEVAELEEVMKQFKDEELVFKGFFVDKDGKVKLDESYVFDKDTTVYMIFETKDGDMSVVPTPGDKPTTKPTTKPTQKEETVKTDDESNMTLYASFAGLALVGGAIIILNKKREELMK